MSKGRVVGEARVRRPLGREVRAARVDRHVANTEPSRPWREMQSAISSVPPSSMASKAEI
jgi:hypothetical protein